MIEDTIAKKVTQLIQDLTTTLKVINESDMSAHHKNLCVMAVMNDNLQQLEKIKARSK